VDRSFRSGRVWRSLTHLDLSGIHKWLTYRIPDQPQHFGAASDNTAELRRSTILMRDIAPHLKNIQSLVIHDSLDGPQAPGLYMMPPSIFADPGVLALAKNLLPQCKRVEISSTSPQKISIEHLLAFINRSEIQHLSLHVPDSASLESFFSLRKGKQLPKLTSVVIAPVMGMSNSLPDPVPMVYGLSEMTGQLVSVQIQTYFHDRSKSEAFAEVIRRLVAKNPNLGMVYLPNEMPDAVFPLETPESEEAVDFDFEYVEKTCMELYHLPIAKLRLGPGWFPFFLQRISSGQKLGLALASVWQEYLPVDSALLAEIGELRMMLLFAQSFKSAPVIHFFTSAAQSLLDFWEASSGSPKHFSNLIAIIDTCLTTAAALEVELSQLDMLWIRCRNLIQRFPFLLNGAQNGPLVRLLESQTQTYRPWTCHGCLTTALCGMQYCLLYQLQLFAEFCQKMPILHFQCSG
jgi:hypothetical protein